MFRGGSLVKLDAKGRLALPTRHRAEIADTYQNQLILTVSPDRCLLLYPLPVWERIEAKLSNSPNQKRGVRDLQRQLMGNVSEVEMDGNGRILIAQRLREFAHIGKTAMLLGINKKFEIWDEERWNELNERLLDDEEHRDETLAVLDSLVL